MFLKLVNFLSVCFILFIILIIDLQLTTFFYKNNNHHYFTHYLHLQIFENLVLAFFAKVLSLFSFSCAKFTNLIENPLLTILYYLFLVEKEKLYHELTILHKNTGSFQEGC